MKLQLLITIAIFVTVLTGCDSVVDRDLSASTGDVNTSTSKQIVETPAFAVTATAAEVLHGAASSDRKKYVRATCTVGGCSGFIYDLQTTNDFDESADRLFVFGNANVVIDNVSLERMNGTSLDYLTTAETAGFVFNNPNKSTEPSAN